MKVGLILAASLAMISTIAASGRADDWGAFDCGSNALFLLLKFEGKKCSLNQVTAALPARDRRGYSMAEISDASFKLGLPLAGELINGAQPLPAKPVIAFLRDSKEGHFAILRPVGTSGTMIQIIDPPFAPRIVDYQQMSRDRRWTGRLLAPHDQWKMPGWAPAGLFALAVVAFVLSFALPRFGGRRTF